MAVNENTAHSEVATLVERIGALPPEKRKRLIAQNPLSFSQQRLWIVERLSQGISVYNVPTVLPLLGEFDALALERALRDVAIRHESLRTSFPVFDGQPMQLVSPHAYLQFAVHDLRTMDGNQRMRALQDRALREIAAPFDLSCGPLLRACAFLVNCDSQFLLAVMHHIVSDGWSQNIFVSEVETLYNAYRAAKEATLQPLPLQYRDFAIWQRESYTDVGLHEALSYWRERLSGSENILLPLDHPRPPIQRFDGRARTVNFSRDLKVRLKAIGDREGATLFMVMLAAFKALLHRYTGQEDIVVGSPIANRNRKELEGLIGFFVNSLVLRDSVKSDMTFRELLREVKETALGAYDHQDVPFEKLVEELNPERDMSRNPLFQVIFAVQNTPGGAAQFSLISEGSEMAFPTPTRFDLEIHVWEANENLSALVYYSTDLFESETIDRLLRHYELLLDEVAKNCDRRLLDYSLLCNGERECVLVEFNQTNAAYERDATVHACFEAHVRVNPAAVAVSDNGKDYTYQELDSWANGIAQWLNENRVGCEARVGVLTTRGAGMVAAVLGVLKAGAAYLPLDPAYPQRRLVELLDDADAACIITDSESVSMIGADSRPRLLLDKEGAALRADAVQSAASAESLAYVMYTSGSTGSPKGVCVEHRNIVRLVKQANYATFDANTIGLLYARLAFDASTFELFGPLLNGGRLVIQNNGMASLEELAETVARENVNTLWLTAGLFHQMAERGPLEKLGSLRQWLAGGDVLQPSALRRVLDTLPKCKLINGYGPTECTTFATSHTMQHASEVCDPVPIGRPLQNTRVYVLDDSLQPVPIGVPGELYIAGDGVARGYLNRPDLTAEHFMRDPISTEQDARMYRTGDRARWTEDGVLQFLGRNDGQVKLRGYRIELGEIESALREHPAVSQTVVTMKKRGTDKALVGYVVGREGHELDFDALRAHLRDRLPAYMLPTVFVPLETIPLTPNGKLDRVALPDARRPHETSVLIKPRTPTESAMLPIWKKVLHVDEISVEENFFDLGGNSLTLVELVYEVDYLFGKEVPLPAAFANPTIAALSSWMDGASASEFQQAEAVSHPLITVIRGEGNRPPLFCVPPAGGTSFPYFNMAHYLPPAQPVYALRDPNVVRDGAPCDTIEEMAVYYKETLLAVQPCGPYHLIGWSFGGIAALEIARLLRSEGHEVRLLGLIESVLPENIAMSKEGPRAKFALGNVWRTIRSGIGITLDGYHAIVRNARDNDQVDRSLWSRITQVWNGMAWSLFLKRTNLSDVMTKNAQLVLIQQPSVRDFGRISNANVRALRRYVASPYDGPLTVFRSEGGVHAGRSGEPAQGWDDYARGDIRVFNIPGDHFSIMRNPHARALAASVEQCLNQEAIAQPLLIQSATNG